MPDVCAGHRLAPFTAGAGTARATARMSPAFPAIAAPLRRLPLPATQRLAARAATALTLDAASVIVISSTLEPPSSREEAHARLLSTLSRASARRARTPTRYKFQSLAL